MRIFIISLFALFLIALSVQIIIFWREKNQVDRGLQKVSDELLREQQARGALQAQLDYVTNPTNFEKELKSRFNYRHEGEKFVIIVPSHSTSSPTTTQSQ